jgi:beta-lactam-binding protein with PASTA domain
MKNIQQKIRTGLILVALTSFFMLSATAAMAQTVKVPNVVGMDYMAAKMFLERAGLKCISGKDAKTTGSSKLGNVVWKQNPGAGAMVQKGAAVTVERYLFTNKGQASPEALLPNVVGATLGQAKADLQKYGFLKVTYQQKVSNDPKLAGGVVRAQSPPAGKKYRVDTAITLTVERYVELPKVAVPDLKNMSKDAAAEKLKALKLKGQGFSKNTSRKEYDGKVMEQSPAPGASLRQGDTVKLVFGKYSAAAMEVRFGLNQAKTAYTLAVFGGAQPYSVSLQPAGNWIVGVFAVKPLKDNPQNPGWKFYSVTSRADDRVTIIITEADGKTHRHTMELKKLQR